MAQGAVVLAAGLNLRFMTGIIGPAPMMQWHHMLSMLVFTPLSLTMAFFMLHELARARRGSWPVFALFMLSSFWIAVAMGAHEPVNQLQIKMRLLGDLSPAGKTMTFLDEVLSHWAFFTGYIGLCLSWAWAQARNPVPDPVKPWMWAVFVLASATGAAGIIASLWGDPLNGIIRDLGIIAAVILACEILRWRGGTRRSQPVTVSIQLGNMLAFAVLLLHGLLK